jgi:hypothetical protein
MDKLKARWINGRLCYDVTFTIAADTSILLRRVSGRNGHRFNETFRRGLAAIDVLETEVAKGHRLAVIESDPGRTLVARELHLTGVATRPLQTTGARKRGRFFRRLGRNQPNQ